MRIFNTGQISPSEKQDILNKHKTLYNGFRTMEPKISNEQPLYVQDFAGDKLGMTLNNKGSVKPYTNVGINESLEEEKMCEQCGGSMVEDVCEQCGTRMEGEVGEGVGKLDDIYHEEDLNPSDDFDYVEGGGNSYGTFEKMHHMKEGIATSNAPVSYGKHYDEIEDPYNFQSHGPVGNGKTLRMSNIDEQGFTGGGNAPDFDMDAEPAFDFKSKGPEEGDGPFNVNAPDMDLDTDDEMEAYDFQSGGPDNGGEVYPVFEDSFDKLIDMDNELEDEREELEEEDFDFDEFTSAFESETSEQDISGVQGIYGDMEPAFDFDSEGPGSAGPYQTRNEGAYVFGSDGKPRDRKPGEKLSAFSLDDFGDDNYQEDELEVDFDEFDPRDKSWEEITAHTGEDEFSHVDEDIRESLINQKNKINEMMLRMKVIK